MKHESGHTHTHTRKKKKKKLCYHPAIKETDHGSYSLSIEKKRLTREVSGIYQRHKD